MKLKTDTGKYTKEAIQYAVNLYRKGMPAKTVEALTGMKRRSVNYHAERLGIERNNKSTSLSTRDQKDIRQLYVTHHYSSVQIAEFTGICETKIKRFLRKEGVIRDRVQALRIRFKKRGRVRAAIKKNLETN
ncbi:MAG: hypothetical protein ABJF26_03495 [Lentilitoribacter sp.]